MKSFCIIGLGKFGMSLAQTLAAEGKQVMVIDIDADKVNSIADFVTSAVIGDPTNETVLRSCGVNAYECAVVCMAKDINANVLLTIMLKEQGVKKVVARAINEGHQKVLEHIGVDMIIFPEKDMGEKIGFLLARENVTEFIEFHGYQIIEIKVPTAWIGKNLIELEIRKKYGVNVLAVNDKDGNVTVSPMPTRPFGEGEKVSVIGTDKDIDKLTKQL
jgi:trk system potassium uptake protein TrkA